MRRRFLIGLALVAGLAVAMLVPRHGAAELDKTRRANIMRAAVWLIAANFNNGKLEPVSSGSGSILSQDGVVLTNHHVIWDDSRGRPYDVVIVGLLKSYDQQPELTCAAKGEHIVYKAELDLAMMKCEIDLQGRPFAASAWPTVGTGATTEMVPGDEVYVIGYPGVGGATITVTAGKVSGFQGEDGGAGRHWIKTDASINHGNSGGTAVDSEGLLIGVPSAFRMAKANTGETVGTVGLIRPIEWAKDYVDMAAAGWTPGAQPGGAPGGTGFGGPPQQQAPPTQGGVYITSRVIDAANGSPVRSGLVIVLKPGVRVSEINKNNLAEKFLTKATTDNDGRFRTELPVPVGQKMAVIVIADGYKALYQDGVLDTNGNPPTQFDPWGQIRLDRE